MKLKAKILLLAILPLLAAIGLLSYLGLHHSRNLADQVLAVYEYNLVEAKKQALKEQVDLAHSAINNIISDPNLTEAEAQSAVKVLLGKLEFGEDGYFFAYSQDGVNLVHPMIPEFVGQDLFEFQDRSGNLLIQHLLAAANSGGGYHRYIWERPPLMQQEDKLGYAALIKPWDWMFGTGLYLDSVYSEVDKVKASFDSNIQRSFAGAMGILIITVLLIIMLGLAINLHEHRLADSRLQELVQKFMRLQVNERRKFSRELHDGINQELVSLKFRLELAVKKLGGGDEPHPALHDLNIASSVLNGTIQEVRQISHNLRPVLLDDLGLKPALRALTEQFSERTAIQVQLRFELEDIKVPDDIETTIYRLAQECLTNIEKHADANRVTISLTYQSPDIHFEVSDNGRGFNPRTAKRQGIGLVNMKERVEVIGGTFNLISDLGSGALVAATLPCRQRKRMW
ncbi:cache domain-containing protein [Salinispirillum sp. LH 10-3-1]|uniref:Oxygen sensor histidine kinase NreB n=1 Tax=Salinispirillum sp. LH 10-3-1 TaxID=2952525 RepID=A0AB38YFW9_9GAMM